MKKLVLLLLIFNLFLVINSVQAAVISSLCLDINQAIEADQQPHLLSDKLIRKSPSQPVAGSSSFSSGLSEGDSASKLRADTNDPIVRITQQFFIKKTNNSKPLNNQQHVDLENPNDFKEPFCSQCRARKSDSSAHLIKPKLPNDILYYKHWNSNADPLTSPFKKQKKRILIFMSIGGGGHVSVSNALKRYLEDDYEITIVNFFEEVMSSVDTIRYLTFGKASGEDIYNFCLQNRFISLVNGFTRFGAWSIKYKSTAIESLLQDFIIRYKPDLLISVIPVVNFMILPVAKKLDIPFLVVTNDLDTTNYVNGITQIDYNKFYYTVAFNDKDIYSKFRTAKIPKSQVAVTGFPLRPEFYDKDKDKALIKKDFQIQENKKVVMILMGGAGSFVCYRYVQTLARLKKPMHIVACIGRDERLRNTITGLSLPAHITLSIVGFTGRISDLMSVADVLITKAGPNSICEAMASYLPILIDQTTGNIWWEVLNVDFVKKHKIGDTVTRFKEVNSKITKFLDDSSYISSVKKRMSRLQTGLDFRQRIRCLINRITS